MSQNGEYVLKMDLRHYFTSEWAYRRFLMRLQRIEEQRAEAIGGQFQAAKFKRFDIPGAKRRSIMAPSFAEVLGRLCQKEGVKLCQQQHGKAIAAPGMTSARRFPW